MACAVPVPGGLLVSSRDSQNRPSATFVAAQYRCSRKAMSRPRPAGRMPLVAAPSTARTAAITSPIASR